MLMSTNYLVLNYVLNDPQEIAKYVPSSVGQGLIDNPTTEGVIERIMDKTLATTPKKIPAIYS